MDTSQVMKAYEDDMPQGPRCEAEDTRTKLRCTSMNTKIYHLPGKPVSLQNRWFCQPHGVMMSPNGGGFQDEQGNWHRRVSWDTSPVIVEKVSGFAELKTKTRPAEASVAKPKRARKAKA